MKWSVLEWESELAIPGGDKSPVILCIWIRTKIEFLKLDYNYYQLSNYVFDPDYLRKFVHFLYNRLDLGPQVAFLIGRVFPGHIFLSWAMHFGLISESYIYDMGDKNFLSIPKISWIT